MMRLPADHGTVLVPSTACSEPEVSVQTPVTCCRRLSACAGNAKWPTQRAQITRRTETSPCELEGLPVPYSMSNFLRSANPRPPRPIVALDAIVPRQPLTSTPEQFSRFCFVFRQGPGKPAGNALCLCLGAFFLAFAQLRGHWANQGGVPSRNRTLDALRSPCTAHRVSRPAPSFTVGDGPTSRLP